MKRATFLFAGLFVAMLIFVTACGGGDEATATSPKPTATSTSPTATAPTDAVPPTIDTTCDLSSPVGGTTQLVQTTPSDELKYEKGCFKIKAGSQVVLTYENKSTIFQHNWVLVQSRTGVDVSKSGEGFPAGDPDVEEDDWVPPDDSRVIAHTALLGPGETGEVRFTAPPAGTYEFVCTFPAHHVTKFGGFVVEP